MSSSRGPGSGKRRSMRPHSSFSDSVDATMHAGRGVAIQCQFCPGQEFRRSSLRGEDLKLLALMRYPVRCLRCGQRQAVSFTVAGISVPSHVKQRRARKVAMELESWPTHTATKPDDQG